LINFGLFSLFSLSDLEKSKEQKPNLQNILREPKFLNQKIKPNSNGLIQNQINQSICTPLLDRLIIFSSQLTKRYPKSITSKKKKLVSDKLLLDGRTGGSTFPLARFDRCIFFFYARNDTSRFGKSPNNWILGYPTDFPKHGTGLLFVLVSGLDLNLR
jgi:hypothetical protein